MEYRRYDPSSDRECLWELKAAFERELGEIGPDGKAETYESKLTGTYRDRYLDWVADCVAEEPRCVTVADAGDHLAGYAFLLPESLAMIWDAAILNELYVVPDNRGTGVGDDLLEVAVEVGREQDIPLDRLVLDVAPENERARRFYERWGFEPWGEMIARNLHGT